MIRNTITLFVHLSYGIFFEKICYSKAKKIMTISWEFLMNSALFIRVHNFQEWIIFWYVNTSQGEIYVTKKRKKSIEREKSINLKDSDSSIWPNFKNCEYYDNFRIRFICVFIFHDIISIEISIASNYRDALSKRCYWKSCW